MANWGLDLPDIEQWTESKKPSEQKDVDLGVIQEQQKKAQNIRQQVKKTQHKNNILANFLWLVIRDFWKNKKIVESIYNILELDDDIWLNFIVWIFYPYVKEINVKKSINQLLTIRIIDYGQIKKPSDYLDYIKQNSEFFGFFKIKNIPSDKKDIILDWIISMLETVRVWGKGFWDTLRADKEKYVHFIVALKKDLSKEIF